MGTSRPWVKTSVTPPITSVCLPPQACVPSVCLEAHQSRPCPRNHRSGRVRTWPCFWAAHHSRPARRRPGQRPAFTQTLHCASNEAPVATSRSRCGTYAASRSSIQLVRTCRRARTARAPRLAASQRNEGARELVGQRPLVKQHLRDGARALFACPMPRTESNDRFASPPTTGPHVQADAHHGLRRG